MFTPYPTPPLPTKAYLFVRNGSLLLWLEGAGTVDVSEVVDGYSAHDMFGTELEVEVIHSYYMKGVAWGVDLKYVSRCGAGASERVLLKCW